MSNKIYLHIGLEKTGSTSIQDYLLNESDNFPIGKVYPKGVFKYQNMMELSSLVLPRHKLINMEVPKRIQDFEREVCSFLKKNRHNDIFLSSEHLSSRVTLAEDIKELTKLLKVGNHKLVVIAFYRDPKMWIQSHYKQYISSGGTGGYREYLLEYFKEGFIRNTINYSESLLNWKNCENVCFFKLINFDKSDDIINDYLSFCSLKLENFDHNAKSNISLSEGQVYLLSVANRYLFGRVSKRLFKKIVLKSNLKVSKRSLFLDAADLESTYCLEQNENIRRLLSVE